jgi:hypothetical protein
MSARSEHLEVRRPVSAFDMRENAWKRQSSFSVWESLALGDGCDVAQRVPSLKALASSKVLRTALGMWQ